MLSEAIDKLSNYINMADLASIQIRRDENRSEEVLGKVMEYLPPATEL